MMPEMDGIEACEVIRNTSGLENTIITFLTARGEDYSQVAGFDAGADVITLADLDVYTDWQATWQESANEHTGAVIRPEELARP